MTKRMVEVQVGAVTSIPPGEGRNFLVGGPIIALFSEPQPLRLVVVLSVSGLTTSSR